MRCLLQVPTTRYRCFLPDYDEHRSNLARPPDRSPRGDTLLRSLTYAAGAVLPLSISRSSLDQCPWGLECNLSRKLLAGAGDDLVNFAGAALT